MTPDLFISTYSTPMVNACLTSGLFPSVKMAQAALESAWGASMIQNNMFGIKAAGALSPYWKGASINKATHETYNGVSSLYNLNFRMYDSVQDSISDHTYFLKQNKRYAAVFTAKTPEDQARALSTAGYATDVNYANSLISIINSHNLKALDKKKR